MTEPMESENRLGGDGIRFNMYSGIGGSFDARSFTSWGSNTDLKIRGFRLNDTVVGQLPVIGPL